jgi:hypothetical protein
MRIRPTLKQQVRDFHVPKHRRKMQWRESLFLDVRVDFGICG